MPDTINRVEVKERAKSLLSQNYWPTVAVALLVAFASGNLTNTYRVYSNLENNYNIDSGFSLSPFVVGSGLFGVLLTIFVLYPLLFGGTCWFNRAGIRSQQGTISSGFSSDNYGRVVKTLLLRDVYIILWMLLFIIPGIIKAYQYYMVPYLLDDRRDLSPSEVLRLSRDMTNGRKFDLFVFDLSFILWHILGAITAGILSIFYVFPYIYLAKAEYYHRVSAAYFGYYDPSSASYYGQGYGGPGYGPNGPAGPGYGPNGPAGPGYGPNGPAGPGYGPNGPDYGPNGPAGTSGGPANGPDQNSYGGPQNYGQYGQNAQQQNAWQSGQQPGAQNYGGQQTAWQSGQQTAWQSGQQPGAQNYGGQQNYGQYGQNAQQQNAWQSGQQPGAQNYGGQQTAWQSGQQTAQGTSSASYPNPWDINNNVGTQPQQPPQTADAATPAAPDVPASADAPAGTDVPSSASDTVPNSFEPGKTPQTYDNPFTRDNDK